MTADPQETIIIRRAREGEHVELSALVRRSAQHTWSYPDAFMDWNPEDITIEPHHISEMITNVVEVNGRLAGLYVLRGGEPEMELSRMFVEPGLTRHGLGRRLWDHAVDTARAQGVQVLRIDADPNAEPFYQRMGARTIGEHDWSPPMLPGWRVKIMKFPLR